jgi:hypothetical protein
MKRRTVAAALLLSCAVCAASAGEAATCPGCGADAAREWKFCPFCASRIDAGVKDGAGEKGAGPAAAPARPPGEDMLGDFEDEAQRVQWKALDGCEAVPVGAHATSGGCALKISFPVHPAGAPSLLWEGKPRNLTAYRFLRADVFNAGQHPLVLSLKLKSGSHKKQTTQEYEIPPGSRETVELPLRNIAQRVDLRDITYINFFVWQPERSGIYYLDNIRLAQ